jgi:hypothetical protein
VENPGVARTTRGWHTGHQVRFSTASRELAFKILLRVITMSKVEKLKMEIETLPKEEFTELVRWMSEKDWEMWDREIEADSQAGKLDFLVREARDAKAKRTLKDL